VLFSILPATLPKHKLYSTLHIKSISENMVKLLTLASCLLATFVGHSTGHFLMKYPPSIGFDDALEGTPPCGSFTVDFSKDNATDFHVGGDVLAMVRKSPAIREN
jgi:hypothetical protein